MTQAQEKLKLHNNINANKPKKVRIKKLNIAHLLL
jgi:hypothetical protein